MAQKVVGLIPITRPRSKIPRFFGVFCFRRAGIPALPKIARSQGKSARDESGLTEREVALATSREDRPLSAEISWSGDGGALGKSGKLTKIL